jgi:tetratricopeptide (TPR) repeat protein
MNDLVGKTVSHYTILYVISQGGLWVIYHAEDTRSKRLVALKILSTEFAGDQEVRDRIVRESRSGLEVQDKNICTIHDIDLTPDGQVFVVMDLFRGETLKQRLANGRISPEDAAGIAVQIGQGLIKAHEQGVVHRDIKPPNIFITNDGVVKILDLGLEKLKTAAVEADAPTARVVAYLSPEQTRAETSDQRTDIWSLGVILYQMITGVLPFRGQNDDAVIASIRDFSPQLSLAAGVPREYQAILKKALQKEPDSRYQTAAEFVADLQAVQEKKIDSAVSAELVPARPNRKVFYLIGSAALLLILLMVGIYMYRRPHSTAASGISIVQPLTRIAVLPLQGVREDAKTDFLGVALSDRVTGTLAKAGNLVVRPSSVVRGFRGTDMVAGNELNVEFLLKGSYEYEANSLRLNLSLVNVHTDSAAWRGSIEEPYDYAYRLDDTVARKIIRVLHAQDRADTLTGIRLAPPRNLVAYERLLRGLSCPDDPENTKRAIAMFRQAIAADSTYAPPYNELGFRLHALAEVSPGKDSLIRMMESAFLKAIALNDHSTRAYTTLAETYLSEGKTETAYEISHELLRLRPKSPDAHFEIGNVYKYAGFLDRTWSEMELALKLDPNNRSYRSIASMYFYLGEYDKTLAALDLDSTGSWAWLWKGRTYARMNRPDLAVQYLNRVVQSEHGVTASGLIAHAELALLTKREKDATAALTQLKGALRIDGETWYLVALTAGRAGDISLTVYFLRQAIEAGFFNYVMMLNEPVFAFLRQNADFERTVGMAKIRYEVFKVRFTESHEWDQPVGRP